jgi:hypothetical protein
LKLEDQGGDLPTLVPPSYNKNATSKEMAQKALNI